MGVLVRNGVPLRAEHSVGVPSYIEHLMVIIIESQNLRAEILKDDAVQVGVLPEQAQSNGLTLAHGDVRLGVVQVILGVERRVEAFVGGKFRLDRIQRLELAYLLRGKFNRSDLAGYARWRGRCVHG